MTRSSPKKNQWGACWVIYWNWNLSLYLLHCVAKPNSQLRASLEQTRQAGEAEVSWEGERCERWGLSGLCVRKFKGDRALFLLMKVPLLLVTPSFSSFLSSSEGGHPETFCLLPLFPTSPFIHFSLFFLDCQGWVSPGLEGQELGQDQGKKAEESCCR